METPRLSLSVPDDGDTITSKGQCCIDPPSVPQHDDPRPAAKNLAVF